MKKHLLLMITLVAIMFVLTGCVDAAYEIGVNSDGTLNANYSISSITIDDKGKLNSEILETIQKEFSDAGYDVTLNHENGQDNISVSKDYVTLGANEKVHVAGVQINPMHYIADGAKLKRGFMKNIVEIESEIDLTDLNSENTALLDAVKDIEPKQDNEESADDENPEASKEISEEEKSKLEEEKLAEKKAALEKYLPEMNIKLTLKTNGKIISTNSTVVSADGKEASWLLIPGTNNKIIFECTTGFDKAFLGTAIILGASVLVAVFLIICLIRFYFKQSATVDKDGK